MQDHIKIRPADGTWVVRSGGAVIGESARALALHEGENPAVIYIPRDDLAMALLEPSEAKSHCPYKGEARYYTIIAKSGPIENAAWSYETPKEVARDIAGHLAFYPDKVAVEQL